MTCEKTPVLGFFGYGYDSDAGTLCRLPSNPPGPLGANANTNTLGMDKSRYVSNADGEGWLTVRYDRANPGDEQGSTFPPLPQYLKVELYKVTSDREYFKILEGKQRLKTASVKRKTGGKSYLTEGVSPHTAAATVRFNISKGKLEFNGQTVDAKTDVNNPSPEGTWNLEIPYEVHALGGGYQDKSKFATSWFRIASESHDGVKDRFLHPGRVSLGCTTVTDIANWTDLYNYLIRARADNRFVGTLEIVK